jgi:hypothetical protein
MVRWSEVGFLREVKSCAYILSSISDQFAEGGQKGGTYESMDVLGCRISRGCGALSSPPTSKIVPISGFDTIAGEWEGLSKSVPNMREHARVLLTVREKGHFNFASDRAAGLVLGTGALYIQDGIVFGRSLAGTGMFTLHDYAGKRVF